MTTTSVSLSHLGNELEQYQAPLIVSLENFNSICEAPNLTWCQLWIQNIFEVDKKKDWEKKKAGKTGLGVEKDCF